MTAVQIRDDLLAAQQNAWLHVTSPGASWSGVERAAIASVAIAALDDDDPLVPWVSPSAAGRTLSDKGVLPDASSTRCTGSHDMRRR